MKTNTADKCLDPRLWHACAGGMVQIPQLNSKVFYFPQGHAEHAGGTVDLGKSQSVPPLVLCQLAAIKYMADPETDEVFARITLVPLKPHGLDLEDDGLMDPDGTESLEKAAASFAKTLTQSDANNGGGFSVPRYCAETIFPRLDYSAEPPVQNIVAKDVHGKSWKFRHIYRGTPRRHLLTTGWSSFVNQKKLVAGDSIVFLRAENGDLCVGIRRAKRGGLGGWPEFGSGLNSSSGPFGGFSMFARGGGGDSTALQKGLDNAGVGKVAAESVVQAAALAASGRPFEVVYYPRASTPEFFVKASSVSSSMRIKWCSGMRFKMPFETEDSSRISWFTGTISSVQVADPIRWPNSPWRLLQVTWDEPDLLQNVKRVSPWLVELVLTIPAIYLPLFSPPRKKLRATDFSSMEQPQIPSSFPSSPLCYVPHSNIIPASIQGARHARYLHSSGPFRNGSRHQLDNNGFAPPTQCEDEPDSYSTRSNVSCLLTMATPVNHFEESAQNKSGTGGSQHILLFGQLILPEHQNSVTSSSGPPESSSDEDNSPTRCKNKNDQKGELGLGVETGHGKEFMESEKYKELYRNLAEMPRIEGSEMLRNILYQDAVLAFKRAAMNPLMTS